MVGPTLAHYRILEKIGSGGMGDVYLAEDTKLDRKVALKVLPPELAESEERRARFQREAKAIAALDHPNIVQVFSVEEAVGTHFITMQLVQGKTLTELLPKNGFPLSKLFDIAIPLTDAVAAAHQEGFTHRDLKPDNVMVSEDGRVKVLDFGLAKPTRGFAVSTEAATIAKTGEGMIVGTVAYMSPEQAEGKPVDHRSDVFSLGVVLYEMATGEHPFQGDTAASVMTAILRYTAPAVTEINPALPSLLARIIRRCLAKDAAHRYQTAADIRNELEELQHDLESGVVAPRPKWKHRSGALALVAAILLVTAIVWLSGLVGREAPAPARFINPAQITSSVGSESWPTWSPEGSRLAYEGNMDIWVAQLGSGSPLNRTEDHDGYDGFPDWSPDGRYIAFLSSRDGGGIFIMSPLAGAPRRISPPGRPVVGSRPQWSADSTQIAYAVHSDELFVEIASLESEGFRRIELTPGTKGCWDMSWSRDGRFLAYLDAASTGVNYQPLRVLRVGSTKAHVVTSEFRQLRAPSWADDARLLYFVANPGGGSMDLYQQRITQDGSPEGEPRAITSGVGMRRSCTFSPDGMRLAYSKGRLVSNLWRVPILDDRLATWADAQQITFDEAYTEFVDVSRDGKRLLVTSDRSGNAEIWILPAEGGEMHQLTDHPAMDNDGKWSPDGTQVAFYSNRMGNRDIWIMPSSGGPAHRLTERDLGETRPTWSPDGQHVAFAGTGIEVVAAEGGSPRQIAIGGAYNTAPTWSPDGRRIAFERDEVIWWAPSSGGDSERLTQGPGIRPRWSPDGERIYFLGWAERAGNLWSISLEDGTEQPVTDLAGMRGGLGGENFAVDEAFLYFMWAQDHGDIWVMDVVTDETE